MNRRSFLSRAFSAIVAARMARELSASPIEREEEPAPPKVEKRGGPFDPLEYCSDCTYETQPLIGVTGETIAIARFRASFCEKCRAICLDE